MRVDYVEMPKDPGEAAAFLGEKFAPLLVKFWQEGRHEKALDFDMVGFVRMWATGNLVFLMAYTDEGESAGFLIAAGHRELMRATRVMRIEAVYGPDNAVVVKLLRKLQELAPLLNIEMYHLPETAVKEVPGEWALPDEVVRVFVHVRK